MNTTPPGRYVVFYDGTCRFCQAGVRRLRALARPGVLHPVSFHEPGALDPFPGISQEACNRQMHLVTPEGKVYRSFEAAVRALATRPVLGRIAYLYYIPGLKQLLDCAYSLVARNRYRIMGRAAGSCETGACLRH